jgi:hypothetical protein
MTAATIVRAAVVVACITIGKGSNRVRKTKIRGAAKVITGNLAAHRVIATMLAMTVTSGRYVELYLAHRSRFTSARTSY